MRESIHSLHGDFLQVSGSVEVSWWDYAYWLFHLFSQHISRMQSFQENHPFRFQVRVVLKMFVSLMGHLVACSVRIAADRQTDRQTERHTQTKYYNPRCACAPRVNWVLKAKCAEPLGNVIDYCSEYGSAKYDLTIANIISCLSNKKD